MPTEDAGRPTLERFRHYLDVLVRVQIDPRLRGKVDPSGVVQQTLLEAHRALTQTEDWNDDQRLAWLRRILANNLTDEVRKFTTQGRDVLRERSLDAALEQSSARLAAWLVADQSSPSLHAQRHEQALQLAVKMILAGQLASEAEVHRFRTEAQAAANLDHPNIVSIYEVGEHEGQPYFSMRLVEGCSLAKLIEQHPQGMQTREQQVEAARLLACVARAVHHAHQHRILHRDIKPANILLDRDDQPHVTDFGLAKRVEGDSKLTQTGSIVGTPSYMAPEQAGGKKDITTAVDVYSLGAILYEMLTGRPPFRGNNPLDTLLDVLSKEPARPRNLNPAINRDLETITLKCLDKDPTRRYGSAEALADDLDRWLAGEPIHARPVGGFERGVKWARRRPAIAGLAAAVFLVTILGVVGIAVGWQRAVAAERLARVAEADALKKADAETRAKREAEEARNEETQARKREEIAKNAAVAAQKLESEARGKEFQARKKEEEQRKRAEAERDAKQRALERADGLRLGAEAAAARHDDPALAILLALEAVRRTPHRLTFATLHEAVRDCREMRTLYRTGSPLRFTPDGQSIVGPSGCWGKDGKQTVKAVEWRNPIAWLDLSPDGQRAVSLISGNHDVYYDDGKQPAKHVYTDRVAYIWDTRTGKDLLHLRKHRDHIVSAYFSPDGKQVLTASWDQTAILWDASSGKKLREFTGHQCALRMAQFSPDGGRVLTVTSGWTEGGHGALLSEEEAKNPNSPAARERDPGVVDRKGRAGGSGSMRFAMSITGENPVARVWDARTGKQVAALNKGGEAGGVKIKSTIAWTSLLPGWLQLMDSHTGNRLAKWSEAHPIKTPPFVIDHLLPWWLRGHPGHPTAAAFSPDGKQVAIAFEQGVACVWDAARGGYPRLEQRGHQGTVHALAFAPDGKRLATAGTDRAVRFLDLVSGKTTLILWGHQAAVRLVRFSADGKQVLTGSADGTARLWDAMTGEQLAAFRGHGKEVTSAEFSPDGHHVLTTGADSTARIWSARPRGDLAHVLRGHTGKINSLAFSPDSQRLLTAADDETPRLWDTKTGREMLRLGEGKKLGAVRSARFNTDGTRIITASQNTYIAEKGKVINPSSVHVWDAKSGVDLLALPEHRYAALDARFSNDGKTLLTVSDGNVHINVDSAFKGRLNKTSSGAAGLARVWDAHKGKLLASVEQTETTSAFRWSGGQLYARFNPDARLVLHRPHDGDAFLLADARTGKTKARLSHEKEGWGSTSYFATFSPDGRLIFTTTGWSGGRVWDVQKARPIVLFQKLSGEVTFGVFSPDSRRLAVLAGKTVYIWDVKTRELLTTLTGHEANIIRAVFSPDGKYIVTGAWDQQSLLWDSTTGKTLALFTGHTAAVTHVAFSPDGKQVATGSEDGTVRLWPVDIVAAARQRLPRELTYTERERYAIIEPGKTGTPRQPVSPVALPPPRKEPTALLSGPRQLAPAEEAKANNRLEETRKLADRLKARDELIDLRRSYPGTTQALEAAAGLTRLPSPLDALDASKIPAEERFSGQPKEVVAVLGEHRLRQAGTVRGLQVSPDGRVIASQDDGVVRLWDAKIGRGRGMVTGTLLGFITGTGELATYSNGNVRFWDVSQSAPRQVRAVAHAGSVRVISPDGKTVVQVTDSNAILLWDVGQDQLRQRATLQGHKGWTRVRFSANGRVLATWADNDGVRLWDLSTATPREMSVIRGVPRYDVKLALAPDGKRLAVTAPGSIVQLWDLSGEPKQVGAIKGVHWVGELVFSPNGKTLVIAGSPKSQLLSLWNVTGPEPKKLTELTGHAGRVYSVAFATDGAFLVSGASDCTVRVWDLTATSGRQRFKLRGHTGPVSGVTFAPDRPLLASNSSDGTTRLWDLSEGAVRELSALTGGWGDVAFSPDGQTLAAGSSNSTLRLWDMSGSTPRERAVLAGHSHGPFGFAFSSDGRTLATGSMTPILRLWDMTTAKPRQAFVLPNDKENTSVLSVSLSPCGRLLAGGRNTGEQTLLLWRVTDKGFEPVQMPTINARYVQFSPDGKTLAVADNRLTVSLWDLMEPLPVRRRVLQQQPNWNGVVKVLAFSPDGQLLAAAGMDRRLILWDAADGKLRQQWQLPVEAHCVAFAPDGRHLATGNSNGTVYVFRVGR